MTEIPQSCNQPLVAALLALLALLSRVQQVVAIEVLLNDFVTQCSIQGGVRALLG